MTESFHLPTSTMEALVWLDCFHPGRLKPFMVNRSEAEKRAAREFLVQSRRERAEKKAKAQA